MTTLLLWLFTDLSAVYMCVCVETDIAIAICPTCSHWPYK